MKLDISNHFCEYLFQIPDFDHCVGGTGTENQTVRVKLGTGQSSTATVLAIGNFSDQFAGTNIGKCPMLIGRGRQNVVSCSVKTESGHWTIMNAKHSKIRKKKS